MLNAAPQSGHLLVDVFDTAYAIMHMGIIGQNLELIKAELCFKGKIEYELNILAVSFIKGVMAYL